jgi:hypothetical protein
MNTSNQNDPQRVHVSRALGNGPFSAGDRPLTHEDLEADLQRVRKLATLLDSQFEIAGVKLGWDAIVGLIPVAGDIVTSILALYPLHIANKHKLGKTLQARMALNVAVDWGVGIVPLIGDVIDVAYKANLKNLKLLEKAVEKARRSA